MVAENLAGTEGMSQANYVRSTLSHQPGNLFFPRDHLLLDALTASPLPADMHSGK